MSRLALALVGLCSLASTGARANGLAGAGILDRPRAFQIESSRLRFTYFDQEGQGFQSLATARRFGPGSEALWVAQPQLEVTAKQGERIRHRIWIPVDVITAASPDAVDAVSTASRTQEAGTVDISSQYKVDRDNELSTRFGVHLEENFRSWSAGLGYARHMAEDNAVFGASLIQTLDWFDGYNLGGSNRERQGRSTTNINLAFTQILSPTTVGHVNYGLTVQTGQLGNTWNTVPLVTGEHGAEQLPTLRVRHALVGRLVQGLPWNASLRLSYRFYIDGWGAVTHTIETFLFQRITRFLYVRATYRAHLQRGVDFFQEIAPLGEGYRTADSDLASFDAHTYGGKLALDLPLRRLRALSADIAFERYQRSNGLRVNVYSCSVGFQF